MVLEDSRRQGARCPRELPSCSCSGVRPGLVCYCGAGWYPLCVRLAVQKAALQHTGSDVSASS
jgi:hypothetical protein